MKDKTEKQLFVRRFNEEKSITKDELDDLLVSIMADAIRNYRRVLEKRD